MGDKHGDKKRELRKRKHDNGDGNNGKNKERRDGGIKKRIKKIYGNGKQR
jgi:hypothetical protein